ncbi:MAG TPA: hypothetical protein VI248_20865 [Kineosporiaceae bacterium]
MPRIVLTRASGVVAAAGALQLWLAATAVGPARIAGLVGGLLVLVTAAAVRPRPWRMALVALAVLPFAATTWWSLVTPLVAVLTLAAALAPAEPVPAASPAGRPA